MERKRQKNSRQHLKISIFYAVLVIAWAGLVMMAGQYIVMLIMEMLLGSALNQPFWTLVYYLISYTLIIALIIWLPKSLWQVYQKRRKATAKSAKSSTNATSMSKAPAVIDDITEISAQDLGIQNWPTFVDIALVPIAYVIYTMAGNALQMLMSLFPWYDASQAQNVGFSHYISGWDQFMAVLAIVFIAPIAEEVIMRGWVYGKLRKRLGVVVAMLLTSILFGVLHGQWNVAVTTFVLSMILCGLREITGTIWSGVLLHMLVNGIAFYILYIGVY